MNSKSRFASLETMCRERSALARKEMEYWTTEAEEWKRLKESPGLSAEAIPVQLDWCAESNDHRTSASFDERTRPAKAE